MLPKPVAFPPERVAAESGCIDADNCFHPSEGGCNRNSRYQGTQLFETSIKVSARACTIQRRCSVIRDITGESRQMHSAPQLRAVAVMLKIVERQH